MTNNKDQIAKNRLEVLRKQFNLKQTDVAYICGFATSNRIGRWEKGTAVPSLQNLYMLALLFNVSPQELYPGLYEELAASVAGKKQGLADKIRREVKRAGEKANALLQGCIGE